MQCRQLQGLGNTSAYTACCLKAAFPALQASCDVPPSLACLVCAGKLPRGQRKL
jgi:hypothetical protein